MPYTDAFKAQMVKRMVGDGGVVGASGRNSGTLSVEVARRRGARVKY